MKIIFKSMLLGFSILSATLTYAQAPAGATGLCNDGSAWTGATKKGACRGHKGVKEWYGAAAPAAPAATPTPAAPAPAPAAPTPTPKATKVPAAMPTAAAPGGGNGQVWVNKSSKVYHCSTDKWYGKTKNGAYLSEQDAKAQGYHPDHGKACQ